MTDILRLNEFILIAALVFVCVALVCNVVVLTSRKSAPRKKKELVSVGAQIDTPGTARGEDPEEWVKPQAVQEKSSRRGLDRYAQIIAIVALVLVGVYLVIRCVKSGHGPFANQHEFAVSFVFGILLAYVLVDWRYNIRLLSVAVLPVAACLLVYSLRLDKEVEALVPALQNNLLLSMHVGMAILSYGAACVSFGAAVLFLAHPWLKKRFRSVPRLEVLDELGFKAAVVTFPLLTMMIVLGAIWADTAWGRYWGWDPKETAALVTWLLYAAFLHARVVRGWRGKRAAWLLIIGFAAVLFAYFGNHFLGGLHTYG